MLRVLGSVFGLVGLFLVLVFGLLWMAFRHETAVFGVLLGLVPLPFVGLGLTFWLSARLSTQQQIAAFTHGVAARATVTYRGKHQSIRQNRVHPTLLKWSFSLQGKTYHGSFSTFAPLPEAEEEGQEVTILYLPQRPQTSTLYIA